MIEPQELRDNYKHFVHDQRFQPLSLPFRDRTDSQRVIVGQTFTGSIPNADFGTIGAVTGPSTGGRWIWGGDVILTRLGFQSYGGTEAMARGAGSGFFIRNTDGSEYLLLDLANTTQYVSRDPNLEIPRGHTLFCRVTAPYTLEMIASATIKRRTRYH